MQRSNIMRFQCPTFFAHVVIVTTFSTAACLAPSSVEARPGHLLKFIREWHHHHADNHADNHKSRKTTSTKARKGRRHFGPAWEQPNTPLCQEVGNNSKVLTFDAHTWTRCATITTPTDSSSPMPILFWFHPAGAAANRPQCQRLSQLGSELKFVVVCAEALQGVLNHGGGYWSLPEVVTDNTGNVCNTTNPRDPGSIDLHYVMSIVEHLDEQPALYDTNRLFFAGCSMGSHFTMYISTCVKQLGPERVSAFATHSSGLKVKGDGLIFPADLYNPEFQWGECPDCQYAPIKPQRFNDSLGLKACVFDNTGDAPDFYWSSINLAEEWLRMGNRVELHALTAGVHCEVKDYEEIIQCLDDETGRLRGVNQSKALRIQVDASVTERKNRHRTSASEGHTKLDAAQELLRRDGLGDPVKRVANAKASMKRMKHHRVDRQRRRNMARKSTHSRTPQPKSRRQGFDAEAYLARAWDS